MCIINGTCHRYVSDDVDVFDYSLKVIIQVIGLLYVGQ